MKIKIKVVVEFLLIAIFFFPNFSYSQEKDPFYVRTNKETNLLKTKDGGKAAWVNKGYKLEVIKKEGNWYLVKVHFGKIKEAWVKVSDVEEIIRTKIDLHKWKNIPLLIKDRTGDISSPNFCDFKSLKLNFDDKHVYFLIELAVGWRELFARVKTTGSVGAIYLDADNNKETGYDGGIIFVHRDGKEERKIKKDDPRIGADYRIQVDTGFKSIFQKGSSKMTSEPNVIYKIYSWEQGDLNWKFLDRGEPLFEKSFIEVSVPKKILELKEGENTLLIFEEGNAFGKSRYNVVNFIFR